MGDPFNLPAGLRAASAAAASSCCFTRASVFRASLACSACEPAQAAADEVTGVSAMATEDLTKEARLKLSAGHLLVVWDILANRLPGSPFSGNVERCPRCRTCVSMPF
jgi:hypothetical protein